MNFFKYTVGILTVCFFISLASAENEVVVIPLNSMKKLHNVVTVAAKGGEFSDPAAAVDSIADASASNPYLVVIGPGKYTLTRTLKMKPYVSITGSGRNATILTGAISSEGEDASMAVVSGADFTTLCDLTIDNTGGGNISAALYNLGSAPTIHRVTATVSGSSYNAAVVNYASSPQITDVAATASGGIRSIGVVNLFPSNPRMTEMSATASGGTTNYGVKNNNSSPCMTDVKAIASGGTDSYGVHNSNADASLTLTDVQASASGAAWHNYGIYNDSSSPVMRNVTASAAGGTSSCGVYNDSSSPVMTDMVVSATAGIEEGATSCGVHNDSSSPVMIGVAATASSGMFNYGVCNFSSSPDIRHCTLKGSPAGIYVSGGTTRVMLSSIIGGASVGSGTLTCVNSDDGSDTPLNLNCQP